MRQSQQKNRMRGRGRKGPNPMSRSYESNGPDVKIRGTAAHVAEKYTTLARDALSMGDNVMAENYLQHAEHYNRIVAAAAAQQTSRNEENANNNFGRGPQPDLNARDSDNDDGEGNDDRAADQGSDSNQTAEQNADKDGETRAAPRPRGEARPRRRTRKEPGKDQAREGDAERSGEAVNGNGVHAANGEGTDKRDISSDASMLPQSILGAGATTEAGAED
ncbi:MAG: DUF4167 domain-containing protein [Pseudomonadota bacterium]|nr:DUF4167 domain-containing protein [Pseudomonadota bacterium]